MTLFCHDYFLMRKGQNLVISCLGINPGLVAALFHCLQFNSGNVEIKTIIYGCVCVGGGGWGWRWCLLSVDLNVNAINVAFP